MFLLINKPKGITSHDVINTLRKITSERRIGHAGTLDPNATGLLIVGVRRQSTKKLDQFLKKDKEYVAEIFLGEERDTDDIEGKISASDKSGKEPSSKDISKTVEFFTGTQKQIPPVYCAIKTNGKESYKLARKGVAKVLQSRNVTVYKAEVINYEYPMLKIRFVVSSGTYIRSLARDIGRKLGTGGYLLNLERTKIGKYDLKDSVLLNKLTADNWLKSAFDI